METANAVWSPRRPPPSHPGAPPCAGRRPPSGGPGTHRPRRATSGMERAPAWKECLHDRDRVAVPAPDEELLSQERFALRVEGALAHHVGERPDARARRSAGAALGARRPAVPARRAARRRRSACTHAAAACTQALWHAAAVPPDVAASDRPTMIHEHHCETMRHGTNILPLVPSGQSDAACVDPRWEGRHNCVVVQCCCKLVVTLQRGAQRAATFRTANRVRREPCSRNRPIALWLRERSAPRPQPTPPRHRAPRVLVRVPAGRPDTDRVDGVRSRAAQVSRGCAHASVGPCSSSREVRHEASLRIGPGWTMGSDA